MLVGEEAGRERALGRRSKAAKRVFMALIWCIKLRIYCHFVDDLMERLRRSVNYELNDGSQGYGINCSPKQRLLDVSLEAKG